MKSLGVRDICVIPLVLIIQEHQPPERFVIWYILDNYDQNFVNTFICDSYALVNHFSTCFRSKMSIKLLTSKY